MDSNFKAGFVSFVGKPNVGKSTLLNTILQEKVAIVSHKPQTTREQMQGIYTDDNMQIVFLDTPGIHKHHNQLGKLMNRQATSATKGADVICLLAPCNEPISVNEQHIIRILKERDTPIFLLLTKVDLVTKVELFNKINEWKDLLEFKEIIPISATKEVNLNILLKKIYDYLPVGGKFFEIEQKSNSTSQQITKEVIREKIIFLTRQEVPYSVAVVVESMETSKNLLEISAVIVVERDSQKAILIGKKGEMIKNIGIQARQELEKIFNIKIMLTLFVKVIDEWSNNPKSLKELGYF
ncbi:GTPase Era [Spiroplasma platyhelix]|uniref:GTPase Era n=1 Tax=Spiroplasma platyhelix PALS-1 TaxID=1276218 RepID=A0A846UCM9_9MOLU|nr:GTPase Era [Spiroplasma platyhelix]MBE4703895.1 GTPase Era [Spiroplasma platyhelix PALS-1]NKE38268.1 GTPase Era [Spiroplasma platyhelix PALS-1]UJB29153.1 GTP-binding protein Era [Spiroplasma platyhelix PALS-1]